MKLIHKLTLGFAIVAIILFIVTKVDVGRTLEENLAAVSPVASRADAPG